MSLINSGVRRRVGAVVACGGLTLMGSLAVSSAADAATGTYGDQAPMTVRCTLSPTQMATVTQANLATPAAAAALCAQPGATPAAPTTTTVAGPDNQVDGDCGYSYIYGYNDGGGNAKISVGIGVDAPISYGSATIQYNINSQNLYVSPNINADTWGEVVYHHTGTGAQHASLSADVLLTNGEECYSGGPTTSYTVN